MNARGWRVSVIALGALALGASAWAKEKAEDPTEEISRAKHTMETFKADDPGLEVHLKGAAGYAVFPTIGKGGLVVGGAGGKGILFEKGMATGWTKMTQVSVGATVGGQSYSEVIIFKEQSALNDFKRGQFAVASDASAVAGGAGASQSLKYSRGVAVMTMAKGGLMAEASIGGQKFSFKEFEHPIAPVPKT
jgi:lipid-binding SYLF domain-containing protein